MKLEEILKKRNLTELDLSKWSILNDRTIEIVEKLLKNNPGLKVLNLGSNDLSNKGVSKLLSILTEYKAI